MMNDSTHKRLNALLAVLISLGLLGTATAQSGSAQSGSSSQRSIRTTDSQATQTRQLAVEVTETQARKAQDWGLKQEEWLRYEQLMQGPLGIYSPGLDPLTALGIEARSDQERRYYAELQVRAESQRVERELVYQRAYDEAFKRLYPGLLPINPDRVATDSASVSGRVSGGTQSSGQSAGRLTVFVKDGCAPCDVRVKQLQAVDQSFDVYLVGSRSDDALVRRWASRVGIDPQKVKARTITLNHDGGRWLSTGLQGELPAVVREVNGQWQRQ